MKESKIAEILKIFTKEEIKSFEKFIISPYFASKRDLKGYYTEFKKYHPNFNINREDFFKKLFSDEEFNERKLKNLSSEMVKLAEKILVHNAIKYNEAEFNKQLAVQYKNRKNDKMFFRTLKVFEDKITGNAFSSVKCFKEEEDLEWMKMEYYIGKNEFEKSIQLRVKHTEYITASFLILFLRRLRDKQSFITYNILFEGQLINAVAENIDFHKIIDKLEELKYPLLWLLKVYYYVYKSAVDLQDYTPFRNLKKTFYENIDRFSRLEKFFMFNDLADCCNMRASAGIKIHKKEEINIYKEMFKHNAYSSAEQEYLSIVSYRNVMLSALTEKEYDWLEEFIEIYTVKLKPEYIDNMMNLAKANLNFEKGEFEIALGFITKVQYDFFLYKTDVKNLMLKIYYELNLFDPAFSLIDAYRHFLIETEEIEENFKKQYYNFINTYNKILKNKSTENFKDIDFIIMELDKMDSVASRSWLKQKIAELIKKGGNL